MRESQRRGQGKIVREKGGMGSFGGPLRRRRGDGGGWEKACFKRKKTAKPNRVVRNKLATLDH